MRRWLGRVGVETLFIEPGSPWENGYNESFNVLPGRDDHRPVGALMDPSHCRSTLSNEFVFTHPAVTARISSTHPHRQPPPYTLGASSHGSGQCGDEEDALQKGPEVLSKLCSQATNSAVFGAHRPAFDPK